MSLFDRGLGWEPPRGDLKRGSLAYRVLGGSGPFLILLHGLAGSNRFWGGAYDTLSERARLIVPDLLGFGDSPWLASGFGPDDHVAALSKCLDEAGVDEPALLVGHSLGALIAIRFAVTQPARVRSVIAIAPTIYRNVVDARRRISGHGAMERLFSADSRLAKTICLWMCDHRTAAGKIATWLRPDLPHAVALDAVRHSWQSYSETYRRVIQTADAIDWLPELRCPLVLVAGDHDPLVDLNLLHELSTSRPAIALRVVHGAKHDLPLKFADYCVALIEEAINSSETVNWRPTDGPGSRPPFQGTPIQSPVRVHSEGPRFATPR
jgi:pimeloyl-ACP methyl ester carboxylesterase